MRAGLLLKRFAYTRQTAYLIFRNSEYGLLIQTGIEPRLLVNGSATLQKQSLHWTSAEKRDNIQ